MMAMTTNERLFEAGLMSEFDSAIQKRDEARLREILKSVFVDDLSIDRIIRDYIGHA
jgi:hypothetical protein